MSAVQLLRGHQDSPVCMAFNAANGTLASGAEDGQLLIHDLHHPQQAAQAARLCSKADCPAALAYHPLKPHLLLAAAGPTLHVLDTRQLSGVPLSTSTLCSDDIGALSIHRQGTYVATADDAGDVVVTSWTAADTLELYKRLPGTHQPLAAAIAFRPQRPWEVLSAGMDCCCKRWDFSRGRALHSWSMAAQPPPPPAGAAAAAAAAAPSPANPAGSTARKKTNKKPNSSSSSSSTPAATRQQQGQGAAGGEGDAAEGGGGGQCWNPPWVYGLAVPWVGGKGGGPAAGAVALARGDGVVTVLDGNAADSAPSTSTSGRGNQVSSGGVTGGDPGSLQGGYRVELGRRYGGHRKAAAAVDFLHADGGSRWLVSGGEDGLVLLWDWQVAQQQQQQHAAVGDPRQDVQTAQQQQPSSSSGPATQVTSQGHQGSPADKLAAAGLQQLSVSGPDSSGASSSAGNKVEQRPTGSLSAGCGPAQPCRRKLVNKHKVNAVCSASVDQLRFAWCDTSRTVKLYTVSSD